MNGSVMCGTVGRVIASGRVGKFVPPIVTGADTLNDGVKFWPPSQFEKDCSPLNKTYPPMRTAPMRAKSEPFI